MIDSLRGTWKFLRVCEHVITGALISLVVAGMRKSGAQVRFHPRVVCWWHDRLCRIMKLNIATRGDPPQRAGLLVSNHVSWLDIPVLGSRQYPLAFLSKAEVRAWPLVGWMSELAGTLFIERGAHQSADIAATIGDRVDQGGSVLLFPEGTTSDGSGLLRFHPRLFAIVQQTGAPLTPVALRYVPTRGRANVAPFIGNDDLLPHLWRVLCEPGLEVEIHYLPTLHWQGEDRKSLAHMTHTAIGESLGVT